MTSPHNATPASLTRSKLFAATAAAALGTLALIGCTSLDDMSGTRLGTATLSTASGASAGTAQLVDNGSGVSLAVSVTGMPQGAHGFHLHTTGQCRAPDFQSAGGHLNPYNRSHGTQSPGGAHLGDLPNLQVGAGGNASATFDIEGRRAEVLRQVFDADGTAIVVHAAADDYRSDPSGDAGARLACGVMTPAS